VALKTLTIAGREIEKVDVLKTSPLCIFPADPGKGYVLAHLELECVLLTTRTKALAVQARRELSGVDFEETGAFVGPVREAQRKYLNL
jgi:nucleosome binding factor SPN SPT16 subunit